MIPLGTNMCSGIRQNLKQQRNSASRSVRKSDITSLTSVYFEYFDDRCHFLGADVEHARKSRLSKASQVGLHIPASFCQWSMPWSFGGELSHFFLGGEERGGEGSFIIDKRSGGAEMRRRTAVPHVTPPWPHTRFAVSLCNLHSCNPSMAHFFCDFGAGEGEFHRCQTATH